MYGVDAGTKIGNDFKVEKTLEGYDEDAKLTIDYLLGLETCNGRVGATGILHRCAIEFRDVFGRASCLSSGIQSSNSGCSLFLWNRHSLRNTW